MVENMLEKQLTTFVSNHSLRGCSIAIALSGGADSTALLCGFISIKKQYNLTLSAIHVNYHLRGDQSNADEQFVRDLCSSNALPLTVIDADLSHLITAVEEEARTIRQRVFLKAIHENTCQFVATAHTQNDQAETLLFRLIRGSGVKGMLGMAEVRHDGLIKPLLPLMRSDITAYLHLQKQSWREDSTNAETLYTRNKIRHTVLPILTKINPKAVQHIAQFTQKLQNSTTTSTTDLFSESLVLFSRTRVVLSRRKTNMAATSAPLETLFHTLLCKLELRVSTPILKQLAEASGHTGKEVLLSQQWKMHTLRHTLLFEQSPALNDVPTVQTVSTDQQNLLYSSGLWEFSLQSMPLPTHFSTHNTTAYIDPSHFPLTLRTVTDDDLITPFGTTVPQKCLSLLKKAGFSHWERTRFPLFCSANGAPLWIAATAISCDSVLSAPSSPSTKVVAVTWL